MAEREITEEIKEGIKEEMIASGDLLARRTIQGVLGFFQDGAVSRAKAVAMLQEAGLPAHAYDAPDFPISVNHHLALTLAFLKHHREEEVSATEIFADLDRFHIGRFGVIGLAMQHAPSLAEALQVGLSHPQLVWGHTRLVVSRDADAMRVRFAMTRPTLPGATRAEIDALILYGVLLDLVSVVSMTAAVLGGGLWPDRIDLPCPKPADWSPSVSPPAARVRFDAAQATLIYPRALPEATPRHANRLAYLSYLRAAKTLSQTLVEDVGLAEQVSRWLWASTPPLKRGEIAELVGLSERSLARKLMAEGQSYNRLLAAVQAERAKNLLREPSATAASVAYRLGYSDPAAFSRAFAAWTGAPPAAWRAAQQDP